jgi:aspartate aminotransferase
MPVGYTDVDGGTELQDAVREKCARENGIAYQRDQIIMCNGSKQVMFGARMATVSVGATGPKSAT